ncbi:aspartyl protease family protein [Hyphobacterium sp.]|uniref:aspartyl protease family protein n=1 Tax=Hyphobacterium sp. TaxID=2004662 RepID=UPI003747F63C
MSIRTMISAAALSMTVWGSASAEDILELRQSYAGHYVLPTMVGDRGPFPFILDTGANHTAILELLAHQLGLSFQDGVPDTLYGLTGSDSTVILGVAALDFGAGPAPIDRAVTIDAEVNADLVAFGIIGTDAFRGQRLEIDLIDYAATVDPDATWQESAFDGYIARNGMLLMEGRVGGVDTTFMIDTGATRSFVNRALAEAVVASRQMDRIEVMGMSGPGGNAGEIGIGTVRLPGLCRRNVRALASDFPIFDTLGLNERPAMIIGLDLLDNGIIRIDFEQGVFAIDNTATCRGRSTSLID